VEGVRAPIWLVVAVVVGVIAATVVRSGLSKVTATRWKGAAGIVSILRSCRRNSGGS